MANNWSLHPGHFLDDAIARERRLGLEREARIAAAEAAGEAGVYPEPDERPTHRAQWDETHGRWVEWDEATDTWTVIEDVYRSSTPDPAGPTPAVAGGGAGPDDVVGETWVPGDDHSLDDIE